MKSTIVPFVIFATCLTGKSNVEAQVFISADSMEGSKLYRFDGTTETFDEDIGFASLFQGLVRHNDTLLVADYGTNNIQRFDFDSTHHTTPFASVTLPAFLGVDSSNNVYATELDNGFTTSFDPIKKILQ